MPEPTQEIQPIQDNNVQTQQEIQKQEVKQEPQKEDIVTRVSQFKPPEKLKQEIDAKFNINDLDATIEKLPDPALKEQVLGLKKSLLKGENQKYQEIADLRKQYEQELAKVATWTPERIQTLLHDPNFVGAAQSILNQQQENTSMLSEVEKKMLEENNKQVQTLMQQNQQLLRSQQETQLKTKYADYDAVAVDKFVQDFQSGKRQATVEDAWILINHRNMIQRAYELGLQDKNTQNQERASGMTFETGRNMAQPSTVERQKGESVSQFMKRSYSEHAKQK